VQSDGELGQGKAVRVEEVCLSGKMWRMEEKAAGVMEGRKLGIVKGRM
jgi:hypothetical protein